MLFAAAMLAGCGGDDEASGPLTVYSGREEELVAPLFEQFTRGDGHRGRGALRRLGRARSDDRRGGRRTAPADVFFAQDPGSLGAVDPQLDGAAGGDPRARGRAASATRTAAGSEPPGGRACSSTTRTRCRTTSCRSSVLELTEPEWKGRIGIAPTNASFQAFVTAMRLDLGRRRDAGVARGDEGERREDLREEHADRRGGRLRRDRRRGSSTTTTSRSSRRSSRTRRSRTTSSPGTTRARSSASPGPASSRAPTRRTTRRRFVEFLLSDDAQRFYVEEAEEAEYPLVDGVEPSAGSRAARRDRGARRGADRLRRRAGGDGRAPPRDRLAHLMRSGAVRGRRLW